MSDTNLCFVKNTVYKITCNKCQDTYIGSSIRPLHDRLKEHLKHRSSSVFKHLRNCQKDHSELTIDVIGRNSDPVDLRILEAALIRKNNPKINSREEYTELKELLF